MAETIYKPPSFPALVQEFFTHYLTSQRALSPQTVACYRDAVTLFLRFAAPHLGKSPTAIRLTDISSELSRDEERAYATAALTLRFGERTEGQPPAPLTAEQLLEARRPEDVGSSVWAVFQRTQEMRGGQSGRGATGQRLQTRPVGSIDRSVNLNRALWVLAEEMRKLKA